MSCLKLAYIEEEQSVLRCVWKSDEHQKSCVNLYYYGARYYDPRISMWYGVDPLTEKFAYQSGYIYCSNNPLNRIDPDGMDEWDISEKGKVVNRVENKNEDSFHAVDNDGNRLEGQSITFEYGTVEAQRNTTVDVRDKNGNIVPKDITTFEIKGDDNATELFEFMATPENTNVEWTHAKIGTESSGKNIVGTSHSKESTSVGSYLNTTGYTLREVNHNHPNDNPRASLGDRVNAVNYHTRNPNAKLQIYTNKNNKYTKYDEFIMYFKQK